MAVEEFSALDARSVSISAGSVLTDGHILIGLLDQILAANKHLSSLKDKRVRATQYMC